MFPISPHLVLSPGPWSDLVEASEESSYSLPPISPLFLAHFIVFHETSKPPDLIFIDRPSTFCETETLTT